MGGGSGWRQWDNGTGALGTPAARFAASLVVLATRHSTTAHTGGQTDGLGLLMELQSELTIAEMSVSVCVVQVMGAHAVKWLLYCEGDGRR